MQVTFGANRGTEYLFMREVGFHNWWTCAIVMSGVTNEVDKVSRRNLEVDCLRERLINKLKEQGTIEPTSV